MMSAADARVVPQRLGGVVLGGIRRQIGDMPPRTVGAKPLPYLGVLMIRGVILNPKTWRG